MEELNNLQSAPEIEETQQQPTDSHNQTEAQAKSDAEKNFAALRQAREKAEKERDEYAKKLKAYEEQQAAAARNKHRDPDDIAEYKDIQDVRTQLEELRIRQAFPDIEHVFSEDNIKKFNESEPELAAMLKDMPYSYNKAALAYKHIKRLQESDKYTKEKEAIETNASKPRSSSAISRGTPLSEMNDFIENPEEHRKRLYKEMVAAAQRR